MGHLRYVTATSSLRSLVVSSLDVTNVAWKFSAVGVQRPLTQHGLELRRGSMIVSSSSSGSYPECVTV
jgi:hypothetical protein